VNYDLLREENENIYLFLGVSEIENKKLGRLKENTFYMYIKCGFCLS